MIKVLLLSAAISATPATAEETAAVQDVLAESRYRFCHEDNYPLIESERAFCEFVETDDPICPSLARACQQQPTPVDPDGPEASMDVNVEPGSRAPTGRNSGRDDRVAVRRAKVGGSDKPGERDGDPNKTAGKSGDGKDPNKPGEDGAGQSSAGDGKTPGKTDAPPPPPPPEAKTPDPEVSAAASGFARILFFVLLGLFIAFIVRMILKNVLADSDAPAEESAPDEAAPVVQTNATAAARGAIETDVSRLLARARAAAQRGAFAQAIDDLYAALLRRLDGDGIIHIQPSRTNGDYLRDVRRERSEIAPDVRAILSDVESVHFGSRSPSAELFSRIHDRVVPLVTKPLAIVFFVLAVAGNVSCGRLAAGDVDELDASVFRGDTSPSGIHGIATLLEPVGVDMRQHLEPLVDLPDPGISTLVLLPGYDVGDLGERRLREWVTKGGHLVFAGGYEIPAWAGATIDLLNVNEGSLVVPYRYQDQFGDLSLALPSGPSLRLIEADSILLHSAEPYAAYHVLGEGKVAVFADDRLFMNIALPFKDNSAFLISFFRAMHHRVHVLDGQTSLGANTPLESLARANLWPILLQLFLFLGLVFLWQGRAFGVLRDPAVERRRAFADHVRAMGLAYARAGASRHVLGIYAAWAIERLRERLPREGRRGLTGLAEALATRVGKPTGEVMRVLVEATDAQKEVAPVSQRPVAIGRAPRKDKTQVASDFALFRALDQWLALTSREQKTSKNRSSDINPKRKS